MSDKQRRPAEPDTTPARRERVATDDSLRVERDEADAELARNGALADEVADDVIRVARDRADALVDEARQTLDRAAAASSGDSDVAPQTERQRTREDATLRRERDVADAQLESERRAAGRSLRQFFEAERNETDEKLIDERCFSDEVVAARDSFLAMVSHDLRGLLGALSLATSLVAKALPDDDAGRTGRQHAGTSQRIIARMSRMLDDLLDITSIEAGRLAVTPTSSDVNALVQEVVAAFAPTAAAKQIELAAQLAAGTPSAQLDHDRILQVLANLVSNAVRFTPPSGRITVGAAEADGGVRFWVADTGVGIEADQQERVFDRFHQLRRDRRSLGLGLHISRCIVEAHRGRIWVQSELGVGSTFYFTVPAR